MPPQLQQAMLDTWLHANKEKQQQQQQQQLETKKKLCQKSHYTQASHLLDLFSLKLPLRSRRSGQRLRVNHVAPLQAVRRNVPGPAAHCVALIVRVGMLQP